MTKCVICERRPARANGRCGNCQARIEAEQRRKKPQQPFKFVTYRGHVVGFYHNGGDKLTPRLLQRNPDGLPKGVTIDLNHYVDRLSREQVKKLKRCVLRLAHA